MSRIQYFVVLHQNQWKVTANGLDRVSYRTQADAIRAAIDAAHADGRKGINAQVLVQGRDNQFRTEWTYGHNPYPPKG